MTLTYYTCELNGSSNFSFMMETLFINKIYVILDINCYSYSPPFIYFSFVENDARPKAIYDVVQPFSMSI